ncbi:hypothetical protein [Salipaludibacillus neizhouensis]|uniref:hypothetical protein n=1 Tax=Salipaludibacillus neizhouensis TaxID=885475 RepID=UPI0016016878|nr:hypothetical protein [Salipaludibacillus neizhouensis]
MVQNDFDQSWVNSKFSENNNLFTYIIGNKLLVFKWKHGLVGNDEDLGGGEQIE